MFTFNVQIRFSCAISQKAFVSILSKLKLYNVTSWQVAEKHLKRFGWQVAKIILKYHFCHFTESTCILSCQVGLVQIDKLTSSRREQQTAISPINPRKTDAPFVVGTINIWFVNFNLYSIVDISAVRESIHFALKQPSTLWKTKLIFAAPCYSTTFWVRKYLQVVFEVLLCVECEKDCWQNLVISLPEIGTECAM